MLRDILAFLVLAGLCVGIWFLGDRLGLSEGWRLAIIITLCALYLALLVVQKILAIRRSMRIERQLRDQARRQMADAPSQGQDVLREIEQRFAAALASLRRSKLGPGALAELPWYLMIGPPGSGKTTAIRESGLNFPALGGEARSTRGIGGTRNCDWWFTDRAIFVDTAGRYTSEPDDQEEWGAFLRNLRKNRRSRAINGCLIAVPLGELEDLDEPAVERYAEVIRDRLGELVQHLQVVFPVYLLLTKCDHVAGFQEFFSTRDKGESEQILGATVPWQGNGENTTVHDLVAQAYQEMLDRLQGERVRALTPDHSLAAKATVYRFPIRLRTFEERLQQFIGAVFRDNPFEENARLRGFYFTSATQDGSASSGVAPALAPPPPGLRPASPTPVPPAASAAEPPTSAPSGPPTLRPGSPVARIAPDKSGASQGNEQSQGEAERVAQLLSTRPASRPAAKAASQQGPRADIGSASLLATDPSLRPLPKVMPRLSRRPYFLRQLFSKLVVADAVLAHPHRSRSRAMERRRRSLAVVSLAIASVGLLTLVWSFVQHRLEIRQTAQQAEVLTELSGHAASADVLLSLDRFRPTLEALA
ncbi:MAG: hypothetical protein EA402_00880, partial [Planctomycetota bacterium]